MNRLGRALILSALIHVLVMAGMSLFENMQQPPLQTEITEIDFIAPPAETTKTKQFVREAFVPKKLQIEDDKSLADLFSKERVRVKEQTKAAHTGLTENRETSTAQQPNPPQEKKQQAETSPDGYRQVDIREQLNEMNRASNMPSTLGQDVPNVRVGNFTALNTDRYLYYTFYARVEELIRFRWESAVQSAIDRLERGLDVATVNRSRWVTEAEFVLNPKGELIQTRLLKNSGLEGFDQAAVIAFRQARVFPNPPRDMINEDGVIVLRFGFTVSYQPRQMVRQ